MIASALALMAAAPAAAPDAVTFDIQCVIATESAMASPAVKPEAKVMLMSALTFFSGRVDAEISATELENRLIEQAKTLQGQQIAPLLKSCGEFMQARGKVWAGIGERLQEREKNVHSS